MNRFDPHHREDSSSSNPTYQKHQTAISINDNNNLMASSASPSSTSSASFSAANLTNTASHFPHNNFRGFPELDDHDLAATVVPAVTVVLEGRSICHRINLHHHGSYHSLARALHQMFVVGDDGMTVADEGGNLDLSNAIPGHLIAYEDMENDLLLAGDLSWEEFVRVAKRIWIIPAKEKAREGTRRGA